MVSVLLRAVRQFIALAVLHGYTVSSRFCETLIIGEIVSQNG
jgi:hypothetical protein